MNRHPRKDFYKRKEKSLKEAGIFMEMKHLAYLKKELN